MPYIATSVQLALAFGPFTDSLASFMSIFAITQIPLGIVEGILFVIFVDYLERARPDLTEKIFDKKRRVGVES
jgi:cobalt/nickel transport system permease protein